MRPTSTAWRLGWIALGLGAAAVNTGNNLLYLLLGLMVAAVPLAWIGTWFNLHRLAVAVRPPRHPRAGAPAVIEVTLGGPRRGFDPRGIAVEVLTDDGSWGPGWVERVRAGSTQRLHLTDRAPRRGPRRITGLRLTSRYPLGVLRRTRLVPAAVDFVVLPSRQGAGAGDPRALPLAGSAVLSPRVAGQEYEGLRRGAEHDDVRRIDWKSTARRGELVLRETAGESRSRLDLRLATCREGRPQEARRRFEEEISRLAAAGERVLEGDGELALSVDRQRPEHYAGRQSTLAFLERLARLDPRDAKGGLLPLASTTATAPVPSFEDSVARRTPPAAAHRASVRLALSIGLAALWAFGGMGFAAWAVLFGGVVLTAVRPGTVAGAGGPAHHLWRVTAIVALIGFFGELLVVRQPLASSIHLALFITLYVTFNARTTRDDRLMLLVSFLHLVLAAALTTDIGFALFLLGWLVAALHAQSAWTAAPPPGRRAWRPLVLDTRASRPRFAASAAGAAAGVLLAGIGVFMVLPHLGTGTFSPGRVQRQSVAGFSDRASLGDIGRIKLDRTPVMDVVIENALPEDLDLKWRGAALERFDGRTWSRDSRDSRPRRPDRAGRIRELFGEQGPLPAGQDLVQAVRLRSSEAGVLFAAGRAREIVSDDLEFVLTDDAGDLHARTDRGGSLRYTVISRLPPADPVVLRRLSGPDPPHVRERDLALPALDPRTADLARRLTAGTSTRYDAARAIAQWLAAERRYTLDLSDEGVDDPLAAFLFDGMAGHCEYFASAMIVLARSAGIPARFVTGYLAGQQSRFGPRYLVRQSDAHAWVEVYFPGAGWVAFDPTPPAGRESAGSTAIADVATDVHATLSRFWDDHLIGLDLDDQYQRLIALRDAGVSFARWIRPALAPILSVALAAALWTVVVRTRRRAAALPAATAAIPRAAFPAFYRKLLARLARRGFTRAPHETPAELARRVADNVAPVQALRVQQLTDLYYRVRFDPTTTEREVRPLAQRLLAELEG